jgi:hypothetical protein
MAVYVRNRLFGSLRSSPLSLSRLPRDVVAFTPNAREAALLIDTALVSAERVVYFDSLDTEQLSLLRRPAAPHRSGSQHHSCMSAGLLICSNVRGGRR